MNIYILTLPLRYNYGGILQGWALAEVLGRGGHSVSILDIGPHRRPALLMPLVWGSRVLRKCLGLYRGKILAERHKRLDAERRFRKVSAFVREHTSRTLVESLRHIPLEGCDAIVVGSDQIWRRAYAGYSWKLKDGADLFLARIDDDGGAIRRVAYAASFGVDRWEYSAKESRRIAEALRRFSAIGVREQSAPALLAAHAGVEATTVVDPTMLLTPDDYVARLGISPARSGRGAVSYILDPSADKKRLVRKVTEAEGLVHTELNAADAEGLMPSPEEWVEAIAGADIVITDSFHGCVFSLIFGKRLIFVGNRERGNTRFDSLVDTFGIKDNMLGGSADYEAGRSYALPPHTAATIARLRADGQKFLDAALGGDEKKDK